MGKISGEEGARTGWGLYSKRDGQPLEGLYTFVQLLFEQWIVEGVTVGNESHFRNYYSPGKRQSGSCKDSKKWLDSRQSLKMQSTKQAERLEVSGKEICKNQTQIFVFRNSKSDLGAD